MKSSCFWIRNCWSNGSTWSTAENCQFSDGPLYWRIKQCRNHSNFIGRRRNQVTSIACVRCDSPYEQEYDSRQLNLHEEIPVGDPWEVPPRLWVVFSDLHVSASTLSTCLEVLYRAREEAKARGAGIAFLGDFWHHRGSLPVEPLNEIVELFSMQWKIPTLMLVGNHDQVSIGGLSHSLTPVRAASAGFVHVFSRPTIYLNALWLPYRRKREEIEYLLKSTDKSVTAIFAHGDVAGANLNDSCQARDGLPSYLFPSHIPSYLGHYHKPHTVSSTKIRYVGSPYQVSRGEIGQKKSLLVLDRINGWSVVDEISLDIGPRHWDVHFPTENFPEELRSGDRVRLFTPRSLADKEQLQKKSDLVDRILKAGASVETVMQPSHVLAPRIVVEDLGPVEIFEKYARSNSLSDKSIQYGIDLLKSLKRPTKKNPRAVNLSFKRVEVEGYISFQDRQSYNLDRRGLVVLTGKIDKINTLDKNALESNGAGKTALAMASLWAVTGEMDTRSDLGTGRGMTNSDIVNENCKSARVKVEGLVNSVPFTVERWVVRNGRGSGLLFELDGKDVTKQEMRLTQEAIDSTLGTQLLGRAAFYGQSEISSLLESTDKTFKDELGKIIDLDVWANAKEMSKMVLTRLNGDIEKALYEIDLKEEYAMTIKSDIDENIEKSKEYKAEQRKIIHELHKNVEESIATTAFELNQLNNFLKAQYKKFENEWRKLREEEKRMDSNLMEIKVSISNAERNLGAIDYEIATQQRQLESYQKLDGQSICDKCLQPLDFENRASTLHTLQSDLDEKENYRKIALSELGEASLKNHEMEAALQNLQRKCSELRILIDAMERYIKDFVLLTSEISRDDELSWVLKSLSQEINCSMKNKQNQNSEDDLSLGAFVNQIMFQYQDVRAKFLKDVEEWKKSSKDKCAESHDYFQENADALKKKLEKEILAIQEAQEHVKDLEFQMQEMKVVDESFRPTGIVSYILEGALGDLQQIANRYLHILAPEISLELHPGQRKGKRKTDPGASFEKIEKCIYISNTRRSLKQLSGGERRRVALALALAFTEFASMRGILRSDLLVLDEVTQHLDGEGCIRAATLFRSLDQYSTILLVAQSGSYFTNVVDSVDTVEKGKRGSFIVQ